MVYMPSAYTDLTSTMTYVQWIVSAMLGVFSLFWVAMTTSNPINNLIQPLGPKMCHRHCSHRVGCSGYLYSPLDLSCRLITEKIRPGQLSPEDAYKSKVSKWTQKIHENDNLTCARNSKIFRTRRRIMKCRYIQIRRSGLETYTRLLMLPGDGFHPEARQFYLGNRSVTTYPYLQARGATGLAYIASKRKLLISTSKPQELFFASLDDNKKTVISRGKHFCGIAVDDEKQLIFLASNFPNKIHVMTAEGTNYKLLKTFKKPIISIALDSQKQVIYTVVLRKHILRLTYEGESQGIVVKGHVSPAMSLNSNGGVLYYFKRIPGYKLFKQTLPNGIPCFIPTPFKPCPYAMYVFSDILYLTPANNRNKIYVLSDSGTQITLIDTGYDSHIQYVVVCAIPQRRTQKYRP